MALESSSRTLRSHRNQTVFIAFCLLGVVALIEGLLVAIALAPRLVSGIRAGMTPPTESVASTKSEHPASSVDQLATSTPSSIPLPDAKPMEDSPVKQMLNDQTVNTLPLHSAQNHTMAGGAALQIINTRLQNVTDGSKKLQITIKTSPQETVDVQQVKVQVYFYDENNGEIGPSKAQVTSTWLNWKIGEPELLEVQYLPDSTDTDAKFAGYLVAIYYKGDLQDCRADPPRLKKLFEPKYYIGSDE